METEKFLATLKGIFTSSFFKKTAAVFVIGAFCAGGSAWYLHEQKAAKKILVAQARTSIIETQAEEKNITLIGTEAVRALTAKVIGVEESALAYKEISLKEYYKKDKHKKKIPAEDIDSDENFRPVYKVSCAANNVKYKLHIDAISGNVIDIKVS